MNATMDRGVGRPSGGLAAFSSSPFEIINTCDQWIFSRLVIDNFVIVAVIGGDFNSRVGEFDLACAEIFEDTRLSAEISNSDKKSNDREAPDLWNCLDGDIWNARTEQVFEKYKKLLIRRDLERSLMSMSLQINIVRSFPCDSLPSLYLCQDLPLYAKRTLAQIRLSNIYQSTFYLGKDKVKLEPKKTCTDCNRKELNNIEHLIMRCDKFYELRCINFPLFDISPVICNSLSDFLTRCNFHDAKILCNYFIKCLRLKAHK